MNSKFEFISFTTLPDTNYVNFHKHDCFELVYYINGSGSTNIDGTPYPYSSNTFSITIPEVYHDERHFEKTEIIFIGFKYYDGNINLLNGIYHDNESKTILSTLKQMQSELLLKKAFYQNKLDLLASELLIEVERLNNKQIENDGMLTNVEKLIRQNYNQNINLNYLADVSGYSYHHFRHIFKNHFGMSPINFIINERIVNAKDLLLNSDNKISEIAQECGFSTNSQFNMLFKRFTGLTPGEFRKINISKQL